MPGDPNYPIPEDEGNKIMHVALPIGKHNVLMGSDTPSFLGVHNENETRSKISISAESKAEADTLFTVFPQGGNVEMPIGDSPWDHILACLVLNRMDDRFRSKISG